MSDSVEVYYLLSVEWVKFKPQCRQIKSDLIASTGDDDKRCHSGLVQVSNNVLTSGRSLYLGVHLCSIFLIKQAR